jgi:hypothetical protein
MPAQLLDHSLERKGRLDRHQIANQTGNPLLESSEENKDFVFYLKKK